MNEPERPSADPIFQWVADYASQYRASLSERPVAARSGSRAIESELEALRLLPEQGISPLHTVQELVRIAEPGVTAMSGPRFFGWVIGGTLPAALAADWLTSTWDQNAGTGEGAPAAQVFENVAIAWVIQLLGLPSNTIGALVPGAMSANFTCLAAARSHVLGSVGWDVQQQGLFGAPNVQVFVGHERHDTIDKAVRLLGLGKQAIRCIETDSQGRMRATALGKALKGYDGLAVVCAQAGNVNSGAFDPVPEIADLVDAFRARRSADSIWLHLDGAFGLWARTARARDLELAALARGAERADSWATDAHKALNVPYDSGIALCRHPRPLRRAMEIGGAYLDSGQERAVHNPGQLVPELSRRARGFALWAALRQLGQAGVAELVDRCARHARAFAAALADQPRISVLNDVAFNQVVVEVSPNGGGLPELATTQVVRALHAEGVCYPTPTMWRGKAALRFAFVNAETTEADVLRSAQALLRARDQA